MTQTQRDLIVSPALGLMIYQTSKTPGFYYYDGTAWTAVSPKGVNKALSNLTSPTAVNQSLIPGMTNSVDLGSSSLMWKSAWLSGNALIAGNLGIGTTTPAAKLDVNGDALVNGVTIGRGKGSMNTYNSALGYQALYSNTTGVENTATGYSALRANTEGNFNTANGWDALSYNTTGGGNTANGDGALYYSTGDGNTAVGISALYNNNTGSYNTASGGGALFFNIAGSNNTALGSGADVSSGDLTNATAIGYGAIVNASNKIVLGQAVGGMVIGGYAAWSNLSDGRFKENIKEDVPGLKFITKLRPVTYTINTKKLEDHIMQNMPDSIRAKRKQKPEKYAKAGAKIQTGFVAQEVEKLAKELNYDFDGVNAPQNPTDNYSIAYSQFVVPLVRAVQELSQQNDELKKNYEEKIDNLQKQIDELRSLIVSTQSTVNSKQSTVLSSAALQQNIPNPFAQTTTISYSLPQKFSSAKMIVTDKSGKVLKQVNLSGSGKGSLNVDASTLASGAYQYSLYVDGKLIDSKQMVLTK
jgi:hypothetical protein